MRLASRCDVIDASGIRRVFDLAKSMTNPINLSIGQPDFDVPEVIKQSAIDAIMNGENSYTPTQGDARLLAQFTDQEEAYSGRNLSQDQVMVTSGVSGGLFWRSWLWLNQATKYSYPIRTLSCISIWFACLAAFRYFLIRMAMIFWSRLSK